MSGASFSSVAMRIMSPDGRTVLAELQTIDRTAVRTARNAGDAATAALRAAQHGAAASARAIAGNVGQVGQLGIVGQQSATAMREMAGQLANITRTGAASGEAIKGLITHGAGLAFAFGPTGAIAASVALLGVSFVNMFRRTRGEIDETVKKFQDGLVEMVNAGDYAGLMRQARRLWEGTPAGNFKDGVKAFEARERELIVEKTRIEGVAFGILTDDYKAVTRELEELQKKLAVERAKLEDVRRRIVNTGNVPRESSGLPAVTVTARGGSGLSFTPEQDAAQGRRLESLLGMRAPEAKAFGFDPVPFNPIEFWERTVQTIQDGAKTVDIAGSVRAGAGADWLKEWDAMAKAMGAEMGATLGDGIANGITTAIQTGDIGKAFAEMTGTILENLGAMMVQVGTQALSFAKIWAKLQAWLIKNPVTAIPVAIGLIAAGSAVRALGAGMRGSAGGAAYGGGALGGGYGGGGYGAGSTIIDRGLINPLNGVVTSPGTIRPRESVQINSPIFIGTNDPVAQRQLVEMVRKGLARSGSTI